MTTCSTAPHTNLPDTSGEFTFEPGRPADYARLAHHHYKAGPPATIARRPDGLPCIIAARDRDSRLAGVLVVSMPTLNSSWRGIAWPGAYNTPDKRHNAHAINRTLRCVSRVIVDPRFRGLGVARSLVRAYLNAPLTPRTEAIAAMGHVCPFFETAGMTAYRLPPIRRNARLLDALASTGTEGWELLERAAAERILLKHPWLAREARAWASDSPGTRRFKHDEPTAVLMLAASHASQRPIAYAHQGHTMNTTHEQPTDTDAVTLPPNESPTAGPAEPPDRRDLPHAVTFFMTGRERSQVLRALRRLDGDRVFALKRGLGLA